MLLTNSQLIADKLLKINTKKDQLLNARSELLSNIFVVDAAPITAMLQTTPMNFYEYVHGGIDYLKSYYQNISIYLTNHINELYILFVCFCLISLIIGYIYLLNRKGTLFIQGEDDSDHRFAFIKRPFSTTIILTVFAAVFVLTDRSVELKYLQVFILIIPLLRLLANIVDRHFMPYIYIFFILYIVQFLEAGISSYGLMERLSALAFIASMFVTVCLAQRQKKFLLKEQMSSLFRYSSKFLILLCTLFAIAFIANAYGTVALSDRISSVAITTLAAILMFYVLANILSGLITIFIHRRIVNAHHLLQSQAQKIERNVVSLITLGMFVWWGLMMVNIFGAKKILLDWTASILAYSWKFGGLTFSVESIFDFFIILTATWLIARMVRIFLDLEVFIRFNFPRGVPTAIAKMSNHTIYAIGIIAALSTLGVTMQEFALIGGALGVGIGFGIRNIVANFISGIIMLFERPVQIGDTIEINNTMGKVQTIGTRATAIKTFDGSEVLIPNADFISADVTNWTLSDERRRAALLIKVDFGSDIEKVLELMSSVAEGHPHVLKDPKPMATFQGFGDYYLEFKLYYWLSTEIIRTKSDIAIGVYNSLKENGIKIPTPTRSIAIRKEDDEV
jgi:small-conductance mechanosensitive channel